MVLLSSRAQQTSSAKQTTSIIKIKVNQSSEASFFQVISGEFFIGKDLTQGTLPCQIPPPLREIVNFAPPILKSPWLARGPTPCPSRGSRWHAHYSYIIIMHVWVTENNYQLNYLVTAVPLENRTIPKKILNLQKTIIQRPIYLNIKASLSQKGQTANNLALRY